MTDTPKKPNTDRVTIPLQEPLTRGNHEIKEIQLRKPKSGELRGLKLGDILSFDIDALHKLLPRITAPALTEAEVSELDPADLSNISMSVAGFFTPKAGFDSLTA